MIVILKSIILANPDMSLLCLKLTNAVAYCCLIIYLNNKIILYENNTLYNGYSVHLCIHMFDCSNCYSVHQKLTIRRDLYVSFDNDHG